MRVYCGLASAGQRIPVAVVDDAGRLLASEEVDDTPAGYAAVCALIADRCAETGSVRSAMATDSESNLVPMLLAASGEPLAVTDAGTIAPFLPPERSGPPDPQQRAVALARALQAGALAAAPQPAPRDLAALRSVLTAHRAATAGRTASVAMLRDLLRELYPAALRAFPDPGTPLALAVLEQLADPAQVAPGQAGEVAGHLAAAGHPDAESAVAALQQAIADTSDRGSGAEAIGATVRSGVAAVRSADNAAATLVSVITEQVEPRTSAQGFAAVPPVSGSPVSGPPAEPLPAPSISWATPTQGTPLTAPSLSTPLVAPPASPPPASTPAASASPASAPAPASATPAANLPASAPPAYGPVSAPFGMTPPASPTVPSTAETGLGIPNSAPPAYGAPSSAPPAHGAPSSAPPAHSAPNSAPPAHAPSSAPPVQEAPSSAPPAFRAPALSPPVPAGPLPAPQPPAMPDQPMFPAEPRLVDPPSGPQPLPARSTDPYGSQPAAYAAPAGPSPNTDELPIASGIAQSYGMGREADPDPFRADLSPYGRLGRPQGPVQPVAPHLSSAVPDQTDAELSLLSPDELPTSTIRRPSEPSRPSEPTSGRLGALIEFPRSARRHVPSQPHPISYGEQARRDTQDEPTQEYRPPSPRRQVPAEAPASSPPLGENDGDLLIFAQTHSAWFSGDNDDSPEQGDWRTDADAGWSAAEAASRPTVGGTTGSGLPRRVPSANLVPGTAPNRDRAHVHPINRDAAQLAAHTAGYFRGWNRARQDVPEPPYPSVRHQ